MYNALEIVRKIKNNEITAVEIVKNYLENIKKKDEDINAFLEVLEGEALKKAENIDKKIESGEKVGRLAGVPIAIKDNISVKNAGMTCASKILENYQAVYNATVIEKILAEDAIIIGKTNLDEFAMGSSTENSAFGKTLNPIDHEYVPGGSSGGSAAAVIADEACLALGSDTGGSIRQPAAFCNISGFKPTYGVVSRYGLTAFASSLDQVGPLAKTVEENQLLFEIIRGKDENDMNSKDFPQRNKIDLENTKIGLPKEYFEKTSPKIKKEIEIFIEKMKAEGYEFVNISLPMLEYSVPTYLIINTAEVSSNLSRFDGIRFTKRSENANNIESTFVESRTEGFGKETKRRIMLGTFALSSGYQDEYYNQALHAKAKISQDFEKAFAKCDIILTPTTDALPFKFGKKDVVSMYYSDLFTCSANLAGIPALSFPIAKIENKFSANIQLMGPRFSDDILLDLGKKLESLRKEEI